MSNDTNPSSIKPKPTECTIDLNVSNFPVLNWDEWEADCKAHFNNCRWMKMWADHLRARDMEYVVVSKQTELVSSLLEKMEFLEQKLELLEQKPNKVEEVKEKIVTFGGLTDRL